MEEIHPGGGSPLVLGSRGKRKGVTANSKQLTANIQKLIPDRQTAHCRLEDWKFLGMKGKLNCQLVIQMIVRTWDKQMATYPRQPGGP